MILPSTGYFNVSWASIPEADEYIARINKNNLFWNSFNTTSNSLFLSGFQEGDSIGGIVYPSKNGNVFPTGIVLSDQSIPVFNFHNENKTFEFEEIFIDGSSINLSNTSSGVFGTGYYEDGSVSVDYSLINPRTDDTMTGFYSEPFLSGVTYIAESESNSYSQPVLDFNFGFSNNLNSRDFDLQIKVNDVYGSGITGNIKLINDPIEINFASQSTESGNISGSGIFNISPTYSSLPTSVDFILKDSTNNIINSGSSSFPFLITGSFPFNETGFMTLIPYDWYGSGISFTGLDSFFHDENYLLSSIPNQINEFDVSQSDSTFTISANYSSNHNSGSFFGLSIDSSSGSFNSDSYFTGFIDDLSSGISFNYFDNRTGIHEDFFFNLLLYQSGSSTIEDSLIFTGSAPYPFFQNTGIQIDHTNGSSEIYFSTSPHYSFSGIDVMISGVDDTAFNIYSGDHITLYSRYPELRAKIVNSNQNSIIYDNFHISGSGEIPSMDALISYMPYLDATNLFNFENLNPLVGINKINVYRKPGFILNTGSLSQDFSGIESFSDFTGNYHSTISFAPAYVDESPPTLPRQLSYQYSDGSFSYLSGRTYFYMFEPVGGFGTGEAVGPFANTFSQNSIGSATETDLVSTETNVSVVQSEVTSLTSFSFNLTGEQFASGDKHFVDNVEVLGDLNVSGSAYISNSFIPAASNASGEIGQISFDENYFYICTGQDSWGRISFDTWI